jgi:hypothetical protein
MHVWSAPKFNQARFNNQMQRIGAIKILYNLLHH